MATNRTSHSAQEPREDPLQACEVCRGQKILESFGMTSLCAWCDGSGLQLSEAQLLRRLEADVTERLRELEGEAVRLGQLTKEKLGETRTSGAASPSTLRL